MVKRILDCTASDFADMNGRELKQSIEAAEGRTVLSEIVVTAPPLYQGLTNAEFSSAFGADLILLNVFDVNAPFIQGMDGTAPEEMLNRLKELVGRPVGMNLEPVDPEAPAAEALLQLPEGRKAVRASLEKAKELGADFVCLTGNPKTGVTNRAIVKSIEVVKDVFGDDGLVIAGKMHAAGVKGESGEEIVTVEVVEQFVEAGADVVLIPGAGTVPGMTLERVARLAEAAHRKGALVLTAIGTSQEGADEDTIRRMALMNKMAGADIHHLGDAGFTGITAPENIFAYSVAIRGRRHTYVRMAASIRR